MYPYAQQHLTQRLRPHLKCCITADSTTEHLHALRQACASLICPHPQSTLNAAHCSSASVNCDSRPCRCTGPPARYTSLRGAASAAASSCCTTSSASITRRHSTACCGGSALSNTSMDVTVAEGRPLPPGAGPPSSPLSRLPRPPAPPAPPPGPPAPPNTALATLLMSGCMAGSLASCPAICNSPPMPPPPAPPPPMRPPIICMRPDRSGSPPPRAPPAAATARGAAPPAAAGAAEAPPPAPAAPMPEGGPPAPPRAPIAICINWPRSTGGCCWDWLLLVERAVARASAASASLMSGSSLRAGRSPRGVDPASDSLRWQSKDRDPCLSTMNTTMVVNRHMNAHQCLSSTPACHLHLCTQ